MTSRGEERVERDKWCEKTETLKWRGLAKVEGQLQKRERRSRCVRPLHQFRQPATPVIAGLSDHILAFFRGRSGLRLASIHVPSSCPFRVAGHGDVQALTSQVATYSGTPTRNTTPAPLLAACPSSPALRMPDASRPVLFQCRRGGVDHQ